MKKFLISTLTVLLLIGAIITFVRYSRENEFIENALWSLNPDGESYRLDQLDPEYSQTSYTVPETINGKPVTVIGYRAFSPFFPNLESITLPSTVNLIESFAFCECTALKSVNIPSGVTEIKEGTFQSCSSLVSINLPGSVTSIGDAAFSNCKSLDSIKIPDSVTSIGTAVFKNCSALTSVTLPNKLSKIPDSAFYSCQSLSSISIPTRVTAIETLAFWGCSSLNEIIIPSGVTTIGGFVFDGIDSVRSLTIPISVKSLKDASYIMGKNLEIINYAGTIKQWYQITGTNGPINYPVHCSDGIIEKEQATKKSE